MRKNSKLDKCKKKKKKAFSKITSELWTPLQPHLCYYTHIVNRNSTLTTDLHN